jgi:hypothetical protein
MKESRRKTILAILLSIAVFVSVYAILACRVASYVQEYEGNLIWPTPGYAFLPWPTTPTGFVIQVIQPLNQADVQYYRNIIQSGLLAVLTLFSWIASIWQVIRLRKIGLHSQMARN